MGAFRKVVRMTPDSLRGIEKLRPFQVYQPADRVFRVRDGHFKEVATTNNYKDAQMICAALNEVQSAQGDADWVKQMREAARNVIGLFPGAINEAGEKNGWVFKEDWDKCNEAVNELEAVLETRKEGGVNMGDDPKRPELIRPESTDASRGVISPPPTHPTTPVSACCGAPILVSGDGVMIPLVGECTKCGSICMPPSPPAIQTGTVALEALIADYVAVFKYAYPKRDESEYKRMTEQVIAAARAEAANRGTVQGVDIQECAREIHDTFIDADDREGSIEAVASILSRHFTTVAEPAKCSKCGGPHRYIECPDFGDVIRSASPDPVGLEEQLRTIAHECSEQIRINHMNVVGGCGGNSNMEIILTALRRAGELKGEK